MNGAVRRRLLTEFTGTGLLVAVAAGSARQAPLGPGRPVRPLG